MELLPFYLCESNFYWEKIVPSSDCKKEYKVTFERSDNHVEYDFKCTCPAFKFYNKYCKHINLVKDEKCNYHQQFDGLEPIDKKCPCCGNDVRSVMCAV